MWLFSGRKSETPPSPRADINTSADLLAEIGLQKDNNPLKSSAVFRCISLIAGKVATLPIGIYRDNGKKGNEALHDHPVWSLIRKKPNAWQTASEFRRLMQTNLLMHGNAYAHKVVSTGRVIELRPIDPTRVSVKQLSDYSLEYKVSNKAGEPKVFTAREILHLRGLSLDGVVGVSVLTYARETIGLTLGAMKHGKNTFDNGTHIGGILSHPKTLGDEVLKTLRKSLNAFRSMGANQGKDLILEEGMTYDKLGMSFEDAQFVQLLDSSAGQIAMFYGVPPHMIGLTDKSTSWGTGIESQNSGFVTYTLDDWLVVWEEGLARSLGLKDNEYVEVNRNALVRGDLKTRNESYTQGRQWGWLSVNDIRRFENMKPVSGGDTYLVPMNMVESTGLGEETDDE